MPLSIPRSQLDRLEDHAREGYPHEVVGILAGRREDLAVTRVEPLRNERADSAHNRYKVSGLALMRAEQELVGLGLEIVGYYHSHPDHPADYSEYDRDHAWPNMSYAIVSVVEGDIADLKSWRLAEDRSHMVEETIHIQED